MWIYVLPVLGYLMGSISSAVVIARMMGLKDPRTEGSGNPGATNILRYGGRKAAVLTLVGDVLKGVVPVLIARALTQDPVILGAVVVAAFLGHLYPVFFGFKGGKGVATAFGVFAALNPWLGLAMAVSWLIVAAAFRYSSLAALTTAALVPVYVWWLLPGTAYLLMALVVVALLFWRHRDNIRRLLAGTESKISLGSR